MVELELLHSFWGKCKSGGNLRYEYFANLEAQCEFCVTLNQNQKIDTSKIIKNLEYSHPIYQPRALSAQSRYREISGINRIHYCGAYWGNGFHEDGVNSALAACKFFG